MSSELRLPNVRISQRNLGEYPDVEVDGVPINGVLKFEFKPPHQLTLVLEVRHLEALREPLHPGPRDAGAEYIWASPAVGEGILVQGSQCQPNVPYVGDGWPGLRKGVVEGLEGTGQFERGSVTVEKVKDGWIPASTLRYIEPIRRGSISGCYTTRLTCDRRIESPPCSSSGNWTGETLAETLRKARKTGWAVTEKKVLCPACAGSTKR